MSGDLWIADCGMQSADLKKQGGIRSGDIEKSDPGYIEIRPGLPHVLIKKLIRNPQSATRY
jgi:hypothetical protein